MLHAELPEDLRVKRTETLLMGALLKLTVQKSFARVTVSDLTKYAGINRATFYRHFEDKFDLLNQYTEAVYGLLDSSPQTSSALSAATPAKSTAHGLVAIFEHLQRNALFYRMMLGSNGDPIFTNKIQQCIKKRIWRSLPTELQFKNSTTDWYLTFSSSASMGAVMWWLEHDLPCSAEEMAAMSCKVSMTLNTILKPV